LIAGNKLSFQLSAFAWIQNNRSSLATQLVSSASYQRLYRYDYLAYTRSKICLFLTGANMIRANKHIHPKRLVVAGLSWRMWALGVPAQSNGAEHVSMVLLSNITSCPTTS
jgi:hypothetical protein